MTDKKLTNNEIIKAFEELTTYSGFTLKAKKLFHNVIDLIFRYKREINRLYAENENLKALNCRFVVLCDRFRAELKTAKSEAYKDFAERLKAEYADFDEENEEILPENLNMTIDDLLKEMIGK